MKTKLLRIYLNTKALWIQSSDNYEFIKELRRKRVKEISKELLEEPLSERLIMLKKISDIVLIATYKEQEEYNDFIEERKKILENFKL